MHESVERIDKQLRRELGVQLTRGESFHIGHLSPMLYGGADYLLASYKANGMTGHVTITPDDIIHEDEGEAQTYLSDKQLRYVEAWFRLLYKASFSDYRKT
jgi:hypothetical protein